MFIDNNIQQLLQRTALKIPLLEFLAIVEKNYPTLGKVLNADAIQEGYEAANIKLITETGKYVLKIYESDRDPQNIRDMIRVTESAIKLGIPFPTLIRGEQGGISILLEEHISVYYSISSLFQGKSMESTTPTIEEMCEIVTQIGSLHTLKFPVKEAYDSWGANNLVQEFKRNHQQLPSDVAGEIQPIVHVLEKLDTSHFTQAIIHGDMQRKHVLKSDDKTYCILDLGCMRNDVVAVDIATYLAWFCLQEDTWKLCKEIIEKVLETYQKKHSLTSEEITAIPHIMRASYAAYFLKTTLLIQDGDQSEETIEWNKKAKTLLKLSNSL
jgi:Ser/Thr protein kinase RdoA (MazF antagonist)